MSNISQVIINRKKNENTLELILDNEADMVKFGGKIAELSSRGFTIYLHGELGAGKTTLARGFLRALGHDGPVKSPTYTLVEHYCLSNQDIYHFDLYRLFDSEELEFMGARDFFHAQSICLVEWAENGEGFLPMADIVINITYANDGRHLQLHSGSEKGHELLSGLDQ